MQEEEVLRKLARVLGCAFAAAALCTPSAQASTPDRTVGGWIEVALQEVAAHRVDPPHASRALGTLSVAMQRAVARATPAASAYAAVDGAASTVLAYFFRDDRGRFQGLAKRSDHAPAGSTAGRGFVLGRRSGAELVARAASDGADAASTATPPVGPEFWVPTPPEFLPPLLPAWGRVLPWNIGDPRALRPPPPPRPGQPLFEGEVREVYDVSRTLTPAQRATALFWADGAGTFTPPGHWNAIALELVRAHGLNTAQAARLFAVLNTAQADALICIWDAKYAYWSLRPITAIRREIDPNWSPLLTTPPFPSYVSGHAGTSGAAATVLSAFFPSEAAQLNAWAREAALSRLYGGIHFRTDNEVGLALGRSVGEAALAAWGGLRAETGAAPPSRRDARILLSFRSASAGAPS
jgi:membrane-associated phospholipid phosphatase